MRKELLKCSYFKDCKKGRKAASQIPAGASKESTDTYQERFMELWKEIHDPENGYFSSQGIPYHSIETLMVEAPDYGHVTTSEALSYYMWLEAMYGKFTGDFSGFKKAWDITETYMIPTEQDQPNSSMAQYSAGKPATYAPEWELPSLYPAQLDFGAAVGADPIHNELVSAYGTSTIYGMHWLLDVDNWYGFGKRGDGVSTPSYINTFQRGRQESTWETIPQPCWEDMKFGGRNGYLDLFTGDSNYAKQFKYTNAPDADARAVQATYWADQWAGEYNIDLDTYDGKAIKMGDYLRYAMFDKYFRKIGSSSTAGKGYDAAHYLLSWYYAWGGGVNANWAWKISCSHSHFGYQNPMAAWILSQDDEFKPLSQNGAKDWGKSLDRQLEFYQWLQSAEGAIAGGVSNSNNGRYESWPSGTATFYGMGYQEHPVYADPGSNRWFGFQAWSMQRVAEYYYKTKDSRAKDILDKWVSWVKTVVKLNDDGTFAIPDNLAWSGQPDTWTGTYTGNPNLHVKVSSYGTDLGITGSLANTLLYYSKASGDDEARVLAKELLDRMWNLYRDDKGLSAPEKRDDYKRFFEQEVYVPAGWTGTMPNGDPIKEGIKFFDIRSKYKDDPDFQKVQDAYNNGTAPEFNYHRFWAECDIALANGVYSMLFGEGGEPVSSSAIDLTSAAFDRKDDKQKDITVTLSPNGNTFTGIKEGSKNLTEGVDYTLTGNTVVLSKAYLAKKETGELKLTFDFSKGVDPVLTVTISDTTPSGSVTPAAAAFDKNPEKQTDVTAELKTAGHTLTGIKLGGKTLTKGVDYTLDGDSVTLLKDSLSALNTGTYNVVFDLSAGIDPVLVLTVSDTSIAAGDIKVQMFNGNTSAQINGIMPRFKIYNTGDTSISLSDLKLRYYYTVDGEKDQNFWCDWSTIGSNNVTGTFVKMPKAKTGADHYLEIGFTAGAGELKAGQSIEVQARFSKTDWSNYTQTEDYSYSDSGSSYADWTKITGYISDSLKWGVEP
ncbi:glycoside hydrolase family 48 protein [Clostridium sp. Marseille-P2415]|uniref:glycoside hydrolase family 48 protein n=1 Tax=Clostridium sp. Marseille-P2415 TaxID=1805471 RepID=UPI00098882BF|nr:glycoside hydrolase family 48 protein [Clostridium sp. Marseille-P2415]